MKVLIFGDSITHGAWDTEKGGWAQRLKLFLGEKSCSSDEVDYTVYNLGISGDTTEELLKRLKFEAQQRIGEEETLLIFAIGINDTQFIHDKGRLRTPLEDFKSNIQEIIKIAQVFSSKIVFLGLTPVDEAKTTPIPWNKNKSYKNEIIKKFNEAIKEICDKESIPFIEVLDDFLQRNYEDLLEDGLHPNPEGHEEIFKIVKKFLTEKEILK